MRKNIKNRIQIRQIPTNSDMNRFMKRLLRCFLALGFSCLTMVSEAALLRIGANQVNLLESAQFLEDPFGQWTLGDVQAMESQFRHWTRGGTEMNFGFTSSAYWIRVPLQRQENAPASWLLEVHFAKLDQLDFYPPSGQVVNTGSSRPFSSRPYFDRHFVFPLDVSNQSDYFYMRVTSNYTLTIPLTVWQPDAYRQHQQRFQWLQFMYYGGLIVLAMYGLIIYLALRDDRFLVYACYIISAGVGMFASNGFGRQLFWSASPAFDEVSQTAFLSLAAFFAALFARKLLTAHGERPWFVNGMRLSEWLFLTSSVLSFNFFCIVLLPSRRAGNLGTGKSVVAVHYLGHGLAGQHCRRSRVHAPAAGCTFFHDRVVGALAGCGCCYPSGLRRAPQQWIHVICCAAVHGG